MFRKTRCFAVLMLALPAFLAIGKEAQTGSASAGFILKTADAPRGISGSLGNETATIQFESRVVNGLVTSQITAEDGRTLWYYDEKAGDVAPSMFVGGAPFDAVLAMKASGAMSTGVRRDSPISRAPALSSGATILHQFVKRDELGDKINALVASPEGFLVKRLALDLVGVSREAALQAERRGLETAFQALQDFYPEHDASEPVANSDYIFTKHGYMVTSQHRSLVLGTNLEPMDSNPPTNPVGQVADSSLSPQRWAKHDENTPGIDGCLGNCGDGCSSSFRSCSDQYWGDDVYYESGSTTWTIYQCDRDHELIASTRTEHRAGVLHTYYGILTNECMNHDVCVRRAGGGVFGHALCSPLFPLAGLSCIGAHQNASWSGVTSASWIEVVDVDTGQECNF